MLLLFISLSLLGVIDSHKRQSKFCTNSADCDATQCCLSPAVFDGKRLIAGYCRPRGAEGDQCYVNNDLYLDQDNATIYFNGCPCESSHRCAGTGQYEVPQGEIGKCHRDTQSKREDGAPCTSRADCSADECCVMKVTIFGRRDFRSLGSCHKQKSSGDSCYVQANQLNDINIFCPCSIHLSCKGIGEYELPFGEKGVCS